MLLPVVEREVSMQLFFTAILLFCLLVATARAEDKPRYLKDDYRYNRAATEGAAPVEEPAYSQNSMADNQLDAACQDGDLAACAKIKQYQDQVKRRDNNTAIIPAGTKAE